MQKVTEVKGELKSAAEDLRAMAAAGHPHASHLQEQAVVLEKAAESCEAILEHPAPVGKSGQAMKLPTQSQPSEAVEPK